MFIIINNGGNLTNAYSTPILINFFKKKKIPLMIINSRDDLPELSKYDKKIKGIILSGSNLSYTKKLCICKINTNISMLLNYNIPVLGICFGFQTIGIFFGGKIKKLTKLNKKNEDIFLDTKHPLFKGLDTISSFKQYHNDYLADTPYNFNVIAMSEKLIQGITHVSKPIFGVQFHPELSDKNGEKVLNNFINFCKKYKKI